MQKKMLSAALVGAVLLSGCVTQQTYQAQVDQTQAYQMLSQQLQAELNTDQVQIQQLQDRLKVTLVNELLFPEAGWRMNRKGEQTLDKIVPTLSAVTTGQIVVQGYTDNLPIGPELRERFPSNWELSAARAADVVRYLVSKGVQPGLISAQAFGDTRPVAANDTPKGRASNRRVEIVITGQ